MILVRAEAGKSSNNATAKKHSCIFIKYFIYKMKKLLLFLLVNTLLSSTNAQHFIHDTSANGFSIIHKDERIDLLGKKMAEYNESLAEKIQMVDGFRLMLLNTTDRNLAMQLRANLLQQFPDQKIYMTFLSPYIKIKLGNFLDKKDAEKLRKQILDGKIVTGNIYILPEKVELKPVEKTTNVSED